ncbi:response regulator [bacterium]|nr:response regulator [bacterium]
MTSQENKKIKLLLIDDEEGVLRAFQLMLEALGFSVVAFTNPADALAQIPEEAPHWIISDLRMPEIDGFEVLKRRNEHYPEIPFILISGHARGEEIEQAKALGAQAVLQKPFDPQELVSLIQYEQRASSHPS